jgi:hypothetical protein
MSIAETPAALAAADDAARWSEIQRQADDLTWALYALREAAPTDDDRACVADVLHWRRQSIPEWTPSVLPAEQARARRRLSAAVCGHSRQSCAALQPPDDRVA